MSGCHAQLLLRPDLRTLWCADSSHLDSAAMLPTALHWSQALYRCSGTAHAQRSSQSLSSFGVHVCGCRPDRMPNQAAAAQHSTDCIIVLTLVIALTCRPNASFIFIALVSFWQHFKHTNALLCPVSLGREPVHSSCPTELHSCIPGKER